MREQTSKTKKFAYMWENNCTLISLVICIYVWTNISRQREKYYKVLDDKVFFIFSIFLCVYLVIKPKNTKNKNYSKTKKWNSKNIIWHDNQWCITYTHTHTCIAYDRKISLIHVERIPGSIYISSFVVVVVVVVEIKKKTLSVFICIKVMEHINAKQQHMLKLMPFILLNKYPLESSVYECRVTLYLYTYKESFNQNSFC